jgi:hypothetical protein
MTEWNTKSTYARITPHFCKFGWKNSPPEYKAGHHWTKRYAIISFQTIKGAVVAVILWWFDLYLPMHTQYLSPLTLWVRIPLMRGVLDATLCDKVCQWLETDRWFSPGIPVFSTNKTDFHNINEILLKVALNTINQATILLDYHIKKMYV